jgi:tetratricopeptide (TPR) repeat protein
MRVKSRIFLSYARENQGAIERVYDSLIAAGYAPWMDARDILPGEKWGTAIKTALRESDFFLVFLSSDSVDKRGFLQKEIKEALDIWKEKLEEDIYLIPVRLEPCNSPASLSEFQWVDLFKEDGWERLIKALTAEIGRRKRSKQPKSRQSNLFDLHLPEGNSVKQMAAASESADMKAKELESVLAFIEQHKGEDAALERIPEAISLGKDCVSEQPETVAFLFKRLDKSVKRLGNKNTVLEAAELAIKAAELCPKPRSEEIVDAHAQALICGISWVNQRLGRYGKARVAAEESYELGEKIKSGVNNAYCSKCLGRLFRMEAEITHDKDRRDANLRQSVALLEEAIDRFSKIEKFGPMDAEVGDCYSLLGRTYLTSKNFTKAEESIRKAYERITDRNSKDYFDLVILSGDLEVERGNRRDAMNHYDEALRLPASNDPEVTEMRARAHFQRGKDRIALKDQSGAIQDFRKAAEIWHSLGEDGAANQARWEEIKLVEKLPTDIFALLSEQEPSVRVAAVESYREQAASRGGARVAQRARPGKAYWEQIIEEARKRTA